VAKVVVIVVNVMGEPLLDLTAIDALDRPTLLRIDGYTHGESV